MADEKKPTKKPAKRRLKAAPTLREQTTSTETPKRRRNNARRIIRLPFQLLGAALRWLGSLIANSIIGVTAVKVWKSRILAPIRFIVRILAKILLIDYFVNSWRELRKVTWPDARTTWKLTFAVIVFGAIFGLAIAGLDLVLEKVFRELLLGS